ncbi:hypothetical protein KIMC2_10260 [Xylocopilactobacillus apis]|uniref:NlpC/P60 domain-containing protein n=2 Tax=Xylocopilactobacillus apis TaxID=2932183 RepID=A0AAU9DLL2_9LACO|nr:hypothetical protein KIMC2_10260 [Xylocopilactobacillus apis]
MLFALGFSNLEQPVQAAVNQGVITINYIPGYGVELWQGYGLNKKKTGRKLADGSAWKYSAVKTAQGTSWYQVGNNLWVSSSQGATPTESEIINKGIAKINYVPGYSIAVWNSYQVTRQRTGQTLKHGTSWTFSQKALDKQGNSWYQVGKNQWISGAYVKVTNTSFPLTSAEIWDPNFAALKVVKNSPIYYDSNFYSAGIYRANVGAIVEVNSTVLNGNTIWYELSDGGWLPSTVVKSITPKRSRVILNGKTKQQAINQVILAAKAQLGKPYVWDGKGPNSFDCSGLMQYVFQQVTGQNIGSWTVPQESAGVKVGLNQLQPGDLLFWGAQGATYHVALYLGNNQYLNALRPGTNIKIDRITADFMPSFGVRIFT